MISPGNPRPPEGFRFAIDNGAWSAYNSGEPFSERGFCRLLESHGAAADFAVVPDIVASPVSLDFSLSWLPKMAHLRQPLLAVQDGMSMNEVSAVLRSHPKLGIFLGGTTEWKLDTMYQWGGVAAGLNRWYHVGRVNTARRIRLAHEAGARSIDGTSASRFSCTVPLLQSAAAQPSLLCPAHN